MAKLSEVINGAHPASSPRGVKRESCSFAWDWHTVGNTVGGWPRFVTAQLELLLQSSFDSGDRLDRLLAVRLSDTPEVAL